jgi:hypothetical protein
MLADGQHAEFLHCSFVILLRRHFCSDHAVILPTLQTGNMISCMKYEASNFECFFSHPIYTSIDNFQVDEDKHDLRISGPSNT